MHFLGKLASINKQYPCIRQTRNDTPEQQWYLQDDKTKIQLAGTTLCMDAGAKGKGHLWSRRTVRI